jgi:hypothetical protein
MLLRSLVLLMLISGLGIGLGLGLGIGLGLGFILFLFKLRTLFVRGLGLGLGLVLELALKGVFLLSFLIKVGTRSLSVSHLYLESSFFTEKGSSETGFLSEKEARFLTPHNGVGVSSDRGDVPGLILAFDSWELRGSGVSGLGLGLSFELGFMNGLGREGEKKSVSFSPNRSLKLAFLWDDVMDDGRDDVRGLD